MRLLMSSWTCAFSELRFWIIFPKLFTKKITLDSDFLVKSLSCFESSPWVSISGQYFKEKKERNSLAIYWKFDTKWFSRNNSSVSWIFFLLFRNAYNKDQQAFENFIMPGGSRGRVLTCSLLNWFLRFHDYLRRLRYHHPLVPNTKKNYASMEKSR